MNPRDGTRLFALLACLALALFAAGCGGDDSDEEGAEISGVIADAILSDDEELICGELLAPEYVDEIYGDEETCLEAELSGADDAEQPDEVLVSEIDIDGDGATAQVEEVGGETDGATGTVSLVRAEEQWQISELGIDYLRSTLSQGLAGVDLGIADEEGEAAFAACLEERLQELDDDSFRALAYESMAGAEPNRDLMTAFADCVEETGVIPEGDPADEEIGPAVGLPDGEEGVSVIRSQFERGLAESALGDDVSREAIACMVDELRDTVSDDEIVDQVARGAEDVSPELAASVARAMANC